jgi:phage terminase small subunit
VIELTPKREAFVQDYIKSGNASAAYRRTISDKGKEASVNVNASRTLADAKVQLRIKELQAELAEKSLWSREKSINVLARIAERGDGKDSDKVNAVKTLNAMFGWDNGEGKGNETPQPMNITFNVSPPVADVRITKGRRKD